jgi:hypothetical protein
MQGTTWAQYADANKEVRKELRDEAAFANTWGSKEYRERLLMEMKDWRENKRAVMKALIGPANRWNSFYHKPKVNN